MSDCKRETKGIFETNSADVIVNRKIPRPKEKKDAVALASGHRYRATGAREMGHVHLE
jgi:hypothetical protein